MRDATVIDVRRRAPAVLVLLALLALLVSVCHGTHGHHPLSARDATTTVTAPALPHGCERPGDTWSFDVHLPAQTVPRPTAPDAGAAVVLADDEVFPADPCTRRVRDRAGPGPEPGRLLIALGVNRN
ncbi:hypothetical protein [Streptomyces zaomyceticus]|uniref:hypothetical protein n=1 Tax=Streptomyces zaomyceticus TaxID=68286 RepID=UPI0016776843|nr:hypothetical protein [Streptomyces zaomyceticus]GHG33411.1 hypothetical protein GCM10018791_58140 [Streptomyces zaomyceticus]